MKITNENEVVGVSGKELNEVSFLQALYFLESNNAKAPYTCTLHPVQVTDLLQNLKSTTGAMWGSASEEGMKHGAFANLYGVDMYRSLKVKLVNDGKDYKGNMKSADGRSIDIITGK